MVIKMIKEYKFCEITRISISCSMPHRLSKADLRKLASEIFHVVPSSQEEAMPIVEESIESLYRALESGMDPSALEPPGKFTSLSSNGRSVIIFICDFCNAR